MDKTTKIVLAGVGVLILVGGLAVGIFLTSQNLDFWGKAAPATTLSISPSSQSKIPGQTVSFTVSMDTGANAIYGVGIDLTFDPDIIEVQSVVKGSGIVSFDQISKNEIDADAGTISYSAYTTEDTYSVSGTDIEVLRITGRVYDDATAGTYSLRFASTTSVSDSAGENVLLNSTPASLLVLSNYGSPDPSPTTTVTPTASASATPTASASATPATELLDSGISLPTLLSVGAGAIAILGSLLLVF